MGGEWTTTAVDSPGGKGANRDRMKAATCLSISQDARFLAVGETGYCPRVLVFSLHETSSEVWFPSYGGNLVDNRTSFPVAGRS